jgi:hypothetical protein
MRRIIGTVCVAALVCGPVGLARAAEGKDAQAIVDKAIKALGGEEKLAAAKGATWKAKGTIEINGGENPFTTHTTVQGLDHLRQEFEGEFGGNTVKGVVVVNGDKGWRSFGGQKAELEGDMLANQKRNIYLTVIPATILPLKDKGFKVEAAGEEKVGDKPAVGLKVTAPDGKDFRLYFDKESGLPVKLVAKVLGFMGEEYTQETTYGSYKDMGGIQKATKIESKRDGQKFQNSEITEFKPLDKVDPKTFAEPD